ncbi:hypothetical protein TNCV_2475641 [Trichonephila clavipes]|nr:hypothetical protein TNCV_2475641 [Trichonephila clavipes]
MKKKGKKVDVPLRTAYSQAGRCDMQPKTSLRAQAQLSETETCELLREENAERRGARAGVTDITKTYLLE